MTNASVFKGDCFPKIGIPEKNCPSRPVYKDDILESLGSFCQIDAFFEKFISFETIFLLDLYRVRRHYAYSSKGEARHCWLCLFRGRQKRNRVKQNNFFFNYLSSFDSFSTPHFSINLRPSSKTFNAQ